MRFRTFFLALSMVAGVAAAQTYPDKAIPLKLVVPFGTGGAADVLARAYAKGITEVSGLNVVVDNRPGAEGAIGVQAVMNAQPDGYTIMLGSSSLTVLNPVTVPNLQYDPLRDLIPAVGLSKNFPVVHLGPSTKFKTVHDFIAAAKANPGKYSFGHATATSRLSGELFESLSGTKLLSVGYKTTAAGALALAAGEIDMYILDSGSMKPFVDGGKVRALAVASSTRLASAPQLPTMREEGVPNYDVTAWFAVYFGAKTPSEKMPVMQDILQKATKAKSFTDVLSTLYMEPFHATSEEITAITRRDIDRWKKVARNPGVASGK
jgi:tripartite-type tricarboxylate transporter receptor subunit TctC